MKLTQSSEMGIHAVWFLAMEGGVTPMLSTDLAHRINVSETYLIKVLKRLVGAKILDSRKGKKGGYRLRRLPATVTLADVVRACEMDDDIYVCQHDDRSCKNQITTCPVAVTMAKAEQAMFDELSRTSIADLVDFCMVRGNPVPQMPEQ
jgi:Rrf2 family protein